MGDTEQQVQVRLGTWMRSSSCRTRTFHMRMSPVEEVTTRSGQPSGKEMSLMGPQWQDMISSEPDRSAFMVYLLHRSVPTMRFPARLRLMDVTAPVTLALQALTTFMEGLM